MQIPPLSLALGRLTVPIVLQRPRPDQDMPSGRRLGGQSGVEMVW